MIFSKLILLIACLALPHLAWSEPTSTVSPPSANDEEGFVWPEANWTPNQSDGAMAASRAEQIHEKLVIRAKELLEIESEGTPEQRAHLLARLKSLRVTVEDNAFCSDEGLPVHYSEIYNQVLVCPQTAEAPLADLTLALARGVALSLSPCHAEGWVLKPDLQLPIEEGAMSVLDSCPEIEIERQELMETLQQSLKSKQAAFPPGMDWTRVWRECQFLDPSPYLPLDQYDKFFSYPFGRHISAAVDTQSTSLTLEMLMQARDKPASAWIWPACHEDALKAFARILAETLME